MGAHGLVPHGITFRFYATKVAQVDSTTKHTRWAMGQKWGNNGKSHFWPIYIIGLFFSILKTNMVYSIQEFLPRYKKLLAFCVSRYTIPVNPNNSVKLHGILVAKLLTKKHLELHEAAVFLLFLYRNLYALGPRIVHLFYVDVCKGHPDINETSCQKKEELLMKAREMLYMHSVNVYDIVAQKPTTFTVDELEKNINLVQKFTNMLHEKPDYVEN